MGVDQLFVDPVAAAYRQFFYIELARSQHHFTGGAVDVVAINVDVGEIVVGANFLHLAQGVLQRMPVPQADVLERGLIVGRVRGVDGGFGRELALGKAVKPVGLPGHGDVVRDVGLLAHQLIGFDDEVSYVPADKGKQEIAETGGQNSDNKPQAARLPGRVEPCHNGPEDKREGDGEQPPDHDVSIGVGDAVEDGVVLKHAPEAVDIDHHGGDKQQKRRSQRQPAPW